MGTLALLALVTALFGCRTIALATTGQSCSEMTLECCCCHAAAPGQPQPAAVQTSSEPAHPSWLSSFAATLPLPQNASLPSSPVLRSLKTLGFLSPGDAQRGPPLS